MLKLYKTSHLNWDKSHVLGSKIHPKTYQNAAKLKNVLFYYYFNYNFLWLGPRDQLSYGGPLARVTQMRKRKENAINTAHEAGT